MLSCTVCIVFARFPLICDLMIFFILLFGSFHGAKFSGGISIRYCRSFFTIGPALVTILTSK